jgi:hypothetical protein
MKANTDRSKSAADEVVGLLLQAVETELGGVEVYRTALKCVQNEELRDEWTKYLMQTERHVRTLQDVCRELGIDPDLETPGRKAVRCTGKALVQTMLLALGDDEPSAVERVAAECVTLAETKDHLNWSLLGELAANASGKIAEVLQRAHEEVEPEEDEHLYHTQGWTRELWMQALGLPAELPPPEEEQDVRSGVGAALVQESRKTTS